MLARLIPRTSEALPVIGCGTYRAFDTADHKRIERLSHVVKVLFSSGGRVIDSSPMYGAAERVAGSLTAPAASASRPFIATKVWTSGKENGVRQMERSLQLFQSSKIDLMQVHNLVDVKTHMPTLIDWKAQGKIRYIGVTHYHQSGHNAVVDAMKTYPVDFIQINYSLEDRTAESRVLPVAHDRGIGVIVNYPFGGGDLIRRLSRVPLPQVAHDLGVTSWGQLLLRYVIANQHVTCAIPGTGDPRHMADNVTAAPNDLSDQRAAILAWWRDSALA